MTLPMPKKNTVERYVGGLSKVKKIGNPIKLSANESALGPSPKAIKSVEKNNKKIFRYPESDSLKLREIISKKFKIDPAIASSVFVTTITDVIGFLSFLGIGASP